MARRREVRDDQHGTRAGYTYGCRCDPCREAERRYERDRPPRVRSGRSRDASRKKWIEENRGYHRALMRERHARVQAESLATATRFGRWEPHEDALLARLSDISAASALGRTYAAVHSRRRKLRAKAAKIAA